WDNFFELGGDSIKALQVSSRLLQAGYKLDMKDLFQYPTVAELSSKIRLASKISDQGEVVGTVRQTPILHAFFEQRHDDAHHYNQAMMFYREQGFEEAALRKTITKIVEHHDALRLVIRRNQQGCELLNRSVSEGQLFSLEVIDLQSEADPAGVIEDQANQIQASINLEEGPLVKLGLFRCADGDHLLIVTHHAAVDGVSWRIIIEDLAAGYEQAVNGAAIRLPQKTDSFQLWADKLSQFANSQEMEDERRYWERIEQIEFASLPKDAEVDKGKTKLKDSKLVIVEWTELETEQLLKLAHRAYHTEMNDLLLTALGLAVQAWTGLDQVLVNLEGHGRESIIPDVDISRTVGWFTSMFPVVLETNESHQLSRQIKQIKEDLRQIPQKGIGYGILRYLSTASDTAGFTVSPEISFNYMGQFDQDYAHSGLAKSPYSEGHHVSGNAFLEHTLDINGIITQGTLQFIIRYSSEAYRAETMERFAQLMKTSLKQVIEHCVANDRQELTPSDVSLKGLAIEELDRLVEQTSPIGEVENVYALTPMQKGMLFHSLMDPQLGAYFEQSTFDLTGSFDVEAFGQSLDLLVQRHEALRTNVCREAIDEPVQVVFRNRKSDLQFEDLRKLKEADCKRYVEEFARKDKEQGFDLSQDTLMRVAILRTGEENYRFIWSFHHMLMDGWCMSLMTKEVFDNYYTICQQGKVQFSQAASYSRYIEWLDQQSPEEASTFWKNYLQAYDQHTLLPSGRAQTGKTEGYVSARADFDLGKPLTSLIERATRQNQVTVNTLIQTVWGVMLQQYNHNRDIVFGSVVSGRPADIAGVENMIGLFINTIPVRVRSEAGETFVELMRKVQEQALASNKFETYPLYEIQNLVDQKQELISHIVAFENYPVEQEVEQVGKEFGFSISNVQSTEQTNYDFNLIIMPGEDIHIRISYNALKFDESDIRRIREHLCHMLMQITANPRAVVDDLELITTEEKLLILQQFNDTRTDYPREKTIHELFEEQAARTP
ncbi:condensation domain-containing protein, partial [Paenibacillus sp. SI8]|uniref:condensation domain-containing protein n=1 Tax=unclassified Paenibacillus TaxID=185978 RepID=UPI003465C456